MVFIIFAHFYFDVSILTFNCHSFVHCNFVINWTLAFERWNVIFALTASFTFLFFCFFGLDINQHFHLLLIADHYRFGIFFVILLLTFLWYWIDVNDSASVCWRISASLRCHSYFSQSSFIRTKTNSSSIKIFQFHQGQLSASSKNK